MQPQPEKIEKQQETATNHPESHGETTKDNDNQHQIQIQHKGILSHQAGALSVQSYSPTCSILDLDLD